VVKRTSEDECILTIVLAAWDLDCELVDCVLSLRSQDIPHRLLVVDNHSRAPLPNVDADVWVRSSTRLTVGAARNMGLAMVETPFVMFMDADDVALPGALATLMQEMRKSPELVSVAGGIVAWDPSTNSREAARWPFAYTRRLQRWRRLFALWNCVRDVYPVTGTVVNRTEVVRRAGGFADVNWAEDWSLGAPMCFGGHVRTLSTPTMLYRTSADHASLSDAKEGRWGPAWLGRKAVRQALRQGGDVPSLVKIFSPLLLPVHAYYCLVELRSQRQRVRR
jgi:glycosyltransferase involved in cell wall biosynthesis